MGVQTFDNTGSLYMSLSTWSQPVFLTIAQMDSLAAKSATWDLASAIRGEVTEWIRGAIVYPLQMSALINDGVISEQTSELSLGAPSLISGIIGPTGVNVRFLQENTAFDLGSFVPTQHYGDYRDYEPYTSYEVYLPYYGYASLKAADILGYTIHVYLKIDWKTGVGLYYVVAENLTTTQTTTSRTIGTYQVNIGYQVPLGQSGALEAGRNIMMGAVKGAATLASMYVTGGAAGVALAGGTTSEAFVKRTARNPDTGRQITKSTVQSTETHTRKPSQIGNVNSLFDTAAGVVNNFQFHPNIDRANNACLDCCGDVYVHFITRRTLSVTDPTKAMYRSLYGRPLGRVERLSNLEGYTEIGAVDASQLFFGSMTSQERDMLVEALQGGIYLPYQN